MALWPVGLWILLIMIEAKIKIQQNEVIDESSVIPKEVICAVCGDVVAGYLGSPATHFLAPSNVGLALFCSSARSSSYRQASRLIDTARSPSEIR